MIDVKIMVQHLYNAAATSSALCISDRASVQSSPHSSPCLWTLGLQPYIALV